MSPTCSGRDLRSSRSGRFDSVISRTTTCGLVTPRTTSRPRNLVVVHRCFSAAVTALSSWITPLCTEPCGSGTCPNFLMTRPPFARVVSAARMDDAPMSTPIWVTAAIGCSLVSWLSGGRGDEGRVPGRDGAGDEQREHRAGEHEGAERDRGLAGGPPRDHEPRADQPAEHETGERPDPHRAPAEPAEVQAEQPGQLHVAHAHPAGVHDRERQVEGGQGGHRDEPA